MKTLVILLLVAQLFVKIENSCQEEDEFLVTTTKLPADLNFMPSLANGHLGFTVFGDSIYMNGVYNGRGGNSRRARLPNWLNISAMMMNEHQDLVELSGSTIYMMNLKEGHFKWLDFARQYGVEMEQRIYAHRFYNRALVYELMAKRNHSDDLLTIRLTMNPGPETKAFDLDPMQFRFSTNGIQMFKATTRVVEDDDFQPNRTELYVAMSDTFQSNQKDLVFQKGQGELYYRFVVVADFSEDVVSHEMMKVLQEPKDDFFRNHSSCWRNFWDNFHIEVKDNIELAQTINAGIFYMASSLPSWQSYHNSNMYYGLSPTGLGRGRLNADYEGHNFWDTEIWMLPVVTQLAPSWSKQLFEYRLQHLTGALHNAKQTGYEGARFPWESAYTGVEVTNPCCPEVAEQEVHISADIVVAMENFHATGHDFFNQWLCHAARKLPEEIATFLANRTTYDSKEDKYHIKDVMGPDEDHEHVDDNVYTNVAFQKALRFACFVQKQCYTNSNHSKCKDWLNQANKMFIMYDAHRDYHPQDLKYQPGEEVKQADTILLGYPLHFEMSKSTRLNDLMIYGNVTRASGPAMTWSMFAINLLDVGRKSEADEYFVKGYKDYVRPEFKVWSETKIGFPGSANFLTGVGGFLQSIINGYGGIRFQLDNNTAKMIIRNPTTFPGSKEFTIKGIKFGDATFVLQVHESAYNTLICSHLGFQALWLQRENNPRQLVYETLQIQFRNERITVQTYN